MVAEGVGEVSGINTEACLDAGVTPECQEYIDCCLTMSLLVGLCYMMMWCVPISGVGPDLYMTQYGKCCYGSV